MSNDHNFKCALQELKDICERYGSTSVLGPFGSRGETTRVWRWLQSSSEAVEVVVQPGSVKELSETVRVLARRGIQFSVGGVGRATSPSVKSVCRIQISLAGLDGVHYDRRRKTVDVGAGCSWGRVYREMSTSERVVFGGTNSEGVADYYMGNNVSLHSRQSGTDADHVMGVQAVLPDGTIVDIDRNNRQNNNVMELFKRGGANFGIISQFTLETFPQKAQNSNSEFPKADLIEAVAKFAKEEVKRRAAASRPAGSRKQIHEVGPASHIRVGGKQHREPEVASRSSKQAAPMRLAVTRSMSFSRHSSWSEIDCEVDTDSDNEYHSRDEHDILNAIASAARIDDDDHAFGQPSRTKHLFRDSDDASSRLDRLRAMASNADNTRMPHDRLLGRVPNGLGGAYLDTDFAGKLAMDELKRNVNAVDWTRVPFAKPRSPAQRFLKSYKTIVFLILVVCLIVLLVGIRIANRPLTDCFDFNDIVATCTILLK